MNVAQESKIPLAQPIIDSEMRQAALHAMLNERLVLGESVYKFEEEFAEYCGTRTAISVNSGTAALALALISLGVQSGEVLTTPLSFVATANAVLHAGATPRFADVNSQSYCLDPERVEQAISAKTKAVIPVHLYGYPSDMDRLCEISNERNVVVVEDACQAHGALYHGRRVGSMGVASCFSFYPSKNMTVGGDGGMVTTNDDSLGEKIRSLRDSGRIKGEKYVHGVIGFTARLNNIQAAIGRVQLRRLDKWNERRREIAQSYTKRLEGTGDLVLPPRGADGTTPVYHLYVIRSKSRDNIRDWLGKKGIETGIHYPVPIHLQPAYQALYNYRKGTFPVSEKLSEEVLSIPMYPALTDEELTRVIDAIREFFANGGKQ